MADGPIDQATADRLAFGPYADALAALIENPETGTPLTIAINAPWGAGKSSLARMVEQRLVADGKSAPGDGLPHITCWFNAWMHDDAPNLATAFAAHVAREANRHRSLWQRLRHPLPRALWSAWERRFFWASLLLVFSVFFVVLSELWLWFARDVWQPALKLGELFAAGSIVSAFVPTPGTETHVGVSAAVLTTLGALLSKPLTAARSVASYLENPEAAANLGTIAEVRAQLGRLLHEARGGARRFIVFIDDLERCRPPRAVDVLEVVNQLIDHPGVVVVIMADVPAVAACADLKYKDIAERYLRPGTRGGDYGRLYLQKIIQLQFDLPPHLPVQLLGMFEGMTEPASSKHDLKETGVVHPLRAAARHAMRSVVAPWRWVGRGLAYVFKPYVALFALIRLKPEHLGPDATAVSLLRWIALPGGTAAVLPFLWAGLMPPYASLGIAGLLLLLLAAARRVDRWTLRVAHDGLRRVIDREPQFGRLFAIPSSDGLLVALSREREWLNVMNDSEIMRQAYAEVAEHLARHPRATKRFVNHLRVIVATASARGAIGGALALSAKHLARFILFKERWPLAAQAVLQRPDLLAEFEAAGSVDLLRVRLEAVHAETWDASALAEFLTSGSTRLGDLAERLVYLTPAHSGDVEFTA